MARRRKKMDPETMEILSSIRQIIDDGADQPAVKSKPAAKKAKLEKPATKKPKAEKPAKKKDEDVLVLTEVAPADETREEETKVIKMPTAAPEPEEAKQEKKSPEEYNPLEDMDMDDALEELVREMLKEKLQDYLDSHLSEIVKKVAAEELAKKRKKD